MFKEDDLIKLDITSHYVIGTDGRGFILYTHDVMPPLTFAFKKSKNDLMECYDCYPLKDLDNN